MMPGIVTDFALGLDLLNTLLSRASSISDQITKARASGAKGLTAEQWTQIKADDDAARQALVDANKVGTVDSNG